MKLYGLFTKELIDTVAQRQRSLIDVDLDDALIDLQLHDVLDIVNVMAALSRKQDGTEEYVPQLFEKEQPQFQTEFKHSEEQYIQLYQPAAVDSEIKSLQ